MLEDETKKHAFRGVNPNGSNVATSLACMPGLDTSRPESERRTLHRVHVVPVERGELHATPGTESNTNLASKSQWTPVILGPRVIHLNGSVLQEEHSSSIRETFNDNGETSIACLIKPTFERLATPAHPTSPTVSVSRSTSQ